VLATPVDGEIVVSDPQSPQDPRRYIITGNYHRLWLVRGDAAVGLDPGQPADRTRWYIRRWRDETTQLGAKPNGPQSACTWGAIKGIYR
jgi:hypothetical protein